MNIKKLNEQLEEIKNNLAEAEPTEKQLSNLTIAWSKMAQQKVQDVEYVKGAYIGLTTELGALRLEHLYNNRPKGQAGYSKNLRSWYFQLDI